MELLDLEAYCFAATNLRNLQIQLQHRSRLEVTLHLNSMKSNCLTKKLLDLCFDFTFMFKTTQKVILLDALGRLLTDSL